MCMNIYLMHSQIVDWNTFSYVSKSSCILQDITKEDLLRFQFYKISIEMRPFPSDGVSSHDVNKIN